MLFIGLIRPGIYSQLFKRELSRKRIGVIGGAILVGSFSLFAITVDPVQQTNDVPVTGIGQNEEQSVDGSSSQVENLENQAGEVTEIAQPESQQADTALQNPVVAPLVNFNQNNSSTSEQKSGSTTAESPKQTPTNTTSGVVKKSESGICHAPGTRYYDRTKNYTSYNSIQACLDSGGKLPQQ